jgi:GNAT superfamily N-acetyltransferase
MYRILQMGKEDIPQVMTIWHRQFSRYCSTDAFPDFWDGGRGTVEKYLAKQIETGNAIVAKAGELFVGYMAWMYFDFHDERTAFCPIVGHASSLGHEKAIYDALYAASSQIWVADNRFNHLWMTFYDDLDMKDMLYDLGFGSYVIDACRKASQNISRPTCPYRIARASHHDVGALLELESELNQYLLEAPIFLRREECSRDEVEEIVSHNGVFVPWDGDRPIGVMSLNVDQSYHFEKLTTPDSGYIGRVGTFVRPEYRGRGVGATLLREVSDYCSRSKRSFVHVSFETANPTANAFWPRFFKLAIRSARRTVNKDANDSAILPASI